MARPNPGPDMQRLADDFVRSMRDFDWELDYSEQSIRMLEEVIDRQFADWRPWRSGKVAKKNLPIASLVGAYLGGGDDPARRRSLGMDAGLRCCCRPASVRNADVTACEGAEAFPQRQLKSQA